MWWRFGWEPGKGWFDTLRGYIVSKEEIQRGTFVCPPDFIEGKSEEGTWGRKRKDNRYLLVAVHSLTDY